MLIEAFIEVISSFFVGVSFALMFRTKKKRLLLCGVAAAFGWGIYCVAEALISGIFMQYFLGAAAVTLYAEIMARITKTPAVVYLLPGLIPAVPGGSLYYTTFALVTGDQAGMAMHGRATGLAALGIAFGLVVISAVVHCYYEIKMGKRAV